MRKDLNAAQQMYTDDEDDEEGDLFMGRVEVNNVTTKKKIRWNLTLSVNGHEVISQIDTGADTNIMSLNEYLRIGFKKIELGGTRSRIFGLGGNEVELFGTKIMDIAVDGKTYSLKFHIIKGNTQSIIGLPAIVNMDILARKDTTSILL